MDNFSQIRKEENILEIPYSAGKLLYFGISSQIQYIISMFNADNEALRKVTKANIEKEMKEVEEAVQFYRKHVVVSASHLEKELEELKRAYEVERRKGLPQEVKEAQMIIEYLDSHELWTFEYWTLHPDRKMDLKNLKEFDEDLYSKVLEREKEIYGTDQ